MVDVEADGANVDRVHGLMHKHVGVVTRHFAKNVDFCS